MMAMGMFEQVLAEKLAVHQKTVAFERWLYRRHGVTLPQLAVLVTVAKGAGTGTMGSIADMVSSSRGNMTGITDRLVRDGYLTRDRSEDDRRVVKVVLTDKGFALLAELKATEAEGAA